MTIAKYELVPLEFNGATDQTDDLVFWVACAMEPVEFAAYLKQELGGIVAKSTPLPESFDVNFKLPQDMKALKHKIQKQVQHNQSNVASARTVMRP